MDAIFESLWEVEATQKNIVKCRKDPVTWRYDKWENEYKLNMRITFQFSGIVDAVLSSRPCPIVLVGTSSISTSADIGEFRMLL